MESQKGRAGGTMCIKDKDVWKSFDGLVRGLEACGLGKKKKGGPKKAG